ncbi:prevent-host-death family protein [Tersicoccus phoenicis]|uniref:Antitoxin n=2 Tax=Tersicoccus phoenicis TaxID=554083 RepID=A0A1R1L9J7_9MICC|nr:prevent-host-death family protein [Tersicoccus phoenicis]
MTTLPLATVRDRLSALVDDVARTHDTLTITRNGTPAAVVLSVEDYDSIMETLALLNDPTDRERLAEADESIAKGDVTTGEEMASLLARRRQRETGTA